MTSNRAGLERGTPVAGLISLGWVVFCWLLFMVLMETNPFGYEITDTLLGYIALGGYLGGITAVIISFVRGERRMFAVITIILLVLSPVFFFGLVMYYLARDMH